VDPPLIDARAVQVVYPRLRGHIMATESTNGIRNGSRDAPSPPRQCGEAAARDIASELIVVADIPTLQDMVSHLRLGDRRDPVIALSTAPDSGEPLLSYEQVRGVVGESPRVYLIPTDEMLRRLDAMLGHGFGLPAGAIRVWWPGIKKRSDAAAHPVIFPVDGEGAAGLQREFARVFRLTHPDVRLEINRIEEACVMAEREASAATQQARAADEGMRDAHLRAEQAEAHIERIDEMSPELKLHTLIAREWRRALTASDRRNHPLLYVLSDKFVEAVARQPQTDLARLSWGCTMVACAYPTALKSLSPHQIRTGAVGSPQRQRADGAKAWRCRAPGTPNGAHMHYWVCDTGLHIFEGIH
jgi:hypothetical protein